MGDNLNKLVPPGTPFKPHEQDWADSAELMDDAAAIRIVKRSLPDRARAELARGPVPYAEEDDHPDGGCRICFVLNEEPERFDINPERHRTAPMLMDWHQGWDLRKADPSFLLGRGPECFRRCMVIYRAAGFDGPVEELSDEQSWAQ